MDLSSIENLKEYGMAFIKHKSHWEVHLDDDISILICKKTVSFIDSERDLCSDSYVFPCHVFEAPYFSTNVSFEDDSFLVDYTLYRDKKKTTWNFTLEAISNDEDSILAEKKKIMLNLTLFFSELIGYLCQNKKTNHEF